MPHTPKIEDTSPFPLPERVVAVSSFLEANGQKETFSIGVGVRTKDHAGLRMVPFNEIVFEIGTGSKIVAGAFSMMPVTARAVAARIVELCDAADQLNSKES